MSSPLLSVCSLSRGGVVFVKATRTIIYAEWFKKTHNYKHFLQSTLGLQVHKCFLDSIFNHSSWKSLGEKTKKPNKKQNPTKTHIQGQEKNISSWMGGTILWPCTSQSHCLFLCTDAGHGPDTRRESPGGQMHQEVCEARPSAGGNSDLTLTARGTTRAALTSCGHQATVL